MDITFYGVRGSTPCHGPDVVRYGGNTSCVSVDVPGHDPILLDLGTGARYFGLDHRDDETFVGHCLLSHLHWDHIQGLPFFPPLLRLGSVLNIHAPVPEHHESVASVVDRMLCPPLFPVGVADLPGLVEFHHHGDDRFRIGEVEITSRLIPHIGNTLGYRLDWNGRSVAYLSDHQQPGVGIFEVAPSALELCDGADLVIHDAQYTEAEFVRKAEWGHCTIEYAIWLAAEAGGPVALVPSRPAPRRRHARRSGGAVPAAHVRCRGDRGPRRADRPVAVVTTLGVIASILVGIAFLVAGGSKLAAGPAWPAMARDLGAPDAAAPVVPWLELAIGAARRRAARRPRTGGCSARPPRRVQRVIAIRLREGKRPACACFGAWSAKPIGAGHLARNAGLAALAVLMLASPDGAARQSVWSRKVSTRASSRHAS